jgi:hypothetical protein
MPGLAGIFSVKHLQGIAIDEEERVSECRHQAGKAQDKGNGKTSQQQHGNLLSKSYGGAATLSSVLLKPQEMGQNLTGP